MSQRSSALDGITVLDFTQALAGPLCTMLLGDLGADVIKIERPDGGDQSRGWGPPFVAGESAYYLSVNRNKRGLTLNLKEPEAQSILHALVDRADVFVVNQPRIESLRSMRSDYDTLSARNPRLIYASITGYGMQGPRAGRPGYDLLAQAESGLMSITGEPDQAPIRFPTPLADATTGVYAALGTLAGLLARHHTGKGQFLDLALLDSQTSWLTIVAGGYFATGERPRPLGNAHPTIVPYQVFHARDKAMVVAVGSERLWKRFCQALAMEDTVGADPRFATNADRLRHRQELVGYLQDRFVQREAAVWLARLQEAGIPCAPINRVDEILESEDMQVREMIVEMEHPLAGWTRSLGNPTHLRGTPATYRLPPPTLGQHTDDILEDLGYDDEAVAHFHDLGIV